jgi:glycosyltransferase involved in cell wall biosynthesis
MKLAVVCDRSANSHYRAIVPLAALESRGHSVAWLDQAALDAAATRTPPWDLLHVFRAAEPSGIALARKLREEGIAVVWDQDDHLTAFVKGDPTTRKLGGKRKIRAAFGRTVEMARAASLMTTPSQVLADVYRDEGVEHATVIENYLARGELARPRRRHVGVVIGCVAGLEHTVDLKRLGIPSLLARLLDRHPQVRVVSIGVDLKLRHPRYVNHRIVPIERLLEHLREFDVGIAPLVDNLFNRSRSNVKLKEYATCGVPWLASPVGPYLGMGEREGGELVADGDWEAALTRMIEDPRHRAESARRARRWAEQQSIAHGAAQWEAAFKAAIARTRREARAA